MLTIALLRLVLVEHRRSRIEMRAERGERHDWQSCSIDEDNPAWE